MLRVIASLALGMAVTAGFQLPRVMPIRPLATVDLITPGEGPIAGGTLVTLNGTGFTNAAVLIDGQPVTPVSQSDTSITLRMAPHDNGYVVIAVAAPGSATVYGRYLYVPPRLEDLPVGYITTVAGIGNFKGDFGPGLDASLLPTSIAIDRDGNLYVTEPDYYEVTRIRPDGFIERFAGTGEAPGPDQECCRDGGPASRAPIAYIKGVAVDRQGNVFIADDTNHRIRRVDAATGIITTFAGTGVRGFSGDGGPAAAARIDTATYLANNGVDLYFMDFGNLRIRRVDANGIVTTVAGTGQRGFWGDGGPATEAMFNFTAGGDDGGLALDPAGNLFIIDAVNGRVRRIDAATRQISTFATFNPLSHPRTIASDRDGNIYFYDGRLQKVAPTGTLIRTWGTPPGDLSPDGTPLDRIRFGYVTGITFDAAGNLVYSDQAIGRVRRMNFTTNTVETIAGTSPGSIGEDGPAVGAALAFHNGADIGITRANELLIADAKVRRLGVDGTLTTIAGRGVLHIASHSNLDNLPALNMYLGAMSLFVGPSDEIDTTSFLAVPYHINASGIARRLTAPPGEDCGYSGDGGPATAAKLCQPWAIVRDRAGNAFIADTNNNRIRRIDAATGVITTIAGNGGPVNGYENYLRGTYCGDGGPALTACLNTPYGLAFDADENLFVSDHGNNRIRVIDRSGIIRTFVEIQAVTTIRFDRSGNLYASPRERVVRFDRAGNMTTIAGARDRPGFSGDGGPALSAQIDTKYGQSRGFAFNDQGDLFFVDFSNRRVRAVRGGAR